MSMFDSMGISSVREVKGTHAQDIVFNGTDIGAVLMISAAWCRSCRQMMPVFEEHAERDRNPHYIIKECDQNMDLFRRLQIRGFPTFLKVTGAGRVKRIDL